MALKDLKNELIEMRKSMEKMTAELHETNNTIRDSLKLTSDTIREMSENFSKTLEQTLAAMQDMKIQMDIKDTIIKTLGIEGILPDFLKTRKK
jgi:methyl-accepting chemotaxis protein